MRTENMQELINKGIAYIQAAEYAGAERVFLNVLEEDKKCCEAYMHLGNAYVNQMEFEKGITAFKTAMMLEPENGLIDFNLGSVYFLQNDWGEAIKYLNQAEQKDYQTEDLFILKCTIFMQSENYPQAIREVSKAIKVKPLKADLYHKKALLQAQAGRLESAIETMETLKELLPDALESYELGVRLYSYQKEYDKALELVEEGIQRFPQDASFLFFKAGVLRSKGDYEQVKQLANQLIGMDTDLRAIREAVVYKAEACGKLGLVEEMKETLEDFHKKYKDAQIIYLLIMIYSSEKKYERVLQLAAQMEQVEKEAEPQFLATAKFSHAEAVLHLEGVDKAKPLYQALAKEFRTLTVNQPELYEVFIYRLLCHTVLEEFDNALELADYLEKAYPENADGYLYRYHIYKKMGREEEALWEKEKALAVNPQIRVQW